MGCKVALLFFFLFQICVISAVEPSRISADRVQIPILFEPNRGQAEPNVKYIARARGYTALLEIDSVRILFRDSTSEVRIELEGANLNAATDTKSATGSEVNYFIGNDPSNWLTKIPTYAAVTYKDVYPGIDWVLYEKDGLLEYDFVVAPGSDPSQIRMTVKGANQISIEKNGDLIAGPLQMMAPFVYQAKSEIPAKYVLATDNSIQFAMDAYDQKKPLVIDPKISFGTLIGTTAVEYGTDVAIDRKGDFCVVGSSSLPRPPFGKSLILKFNAAGTLLWSAVLGGNGGDSAFGVAVTPSGIVYVVGSTSSRDFPVVGAFQPAYGGGTGDGFIVKLSANGSSLLRSSYLGGSGEDSARGIRLGTGSKLKNSIYIFGNTESRNFPQLNSNQSQLRAPNDGFLTIINSLNFTRANSTYIGFNGRDDITSLILNPTRGDLYLTVLNETNPNLSSVTHLRPTGANISAAALYTRKDNEIGSLFRGYMAAIDSIVRYKLLRGESVPEDLAGVSVKADGTGIVLVAGSCLTLPPATTCDNSSSLAFFDQDLNFVRGVNFATFAGLYTNDIAIQGGRIYLVGETTSNNLPVVNALQPTRKGGWEGFIMEMEPTGNILTSTYLGGPGYDFISGVAVSGARNIHVVGSTSTKNFPTTPNAIKLTLGGTTDAFVVKITP